MFLSLLRLPHLRFGASGSLVSVPSYVKRRRLETKRTNPSSSDPTHFSLIHLLLAIVPIGSGCRCTRPPCPKAQAGKRGGGGRLVVISGPPHLPARPAITRRRGEVCPVPAQVGDGCGSWCQEMDAARCGPTVVPLFVLLLPPSPFLFLFLYVYFLFFQSDGLPRGGNY